MQLREAAVGTWKLVEKVSLPFMLTAMGWALLNLMDLNTRMTKVEEDAKGDEAQWRLLRDHTEQLQSQMVEVEVYKRMFEMLLAKDKLVIDRITLPAPTPPPKPVDDFRVEQMQKSKR